MQEIRDIYDDSGQNTGRTFLKGTRLGENEFFLQVVVLLRRKDGRYLFQQRSLNDRHFPGQWDVTGGGVIHGEDSRTAGVREVQEELGIILSPESLVFGGRIQQTGKNAARYFVDMYGVCGDFAAEDCIPAPGEVNAIRMADREEFRQAVSSNKDKAFMELLDQTISLLERRQSTTF